MSDLDTVLGALGVRGRGHARHLTWLGTMITDVAHPRAVAAVADVVYANAYVHGAPTPYEPVEDRGVDPEWWDVATDSRVEATWGGWTCDPDGQLTAPGQPILQLGSVSDDDRSAAIRGLAVRVSAVSTDVIPGWCTIRHGDVRSGPGQARMYANTHPATVRSLVPQLIGTLVDAGLEWFATKMLVGRDHEERADSTVVFLPHPPEPALIDELVRQLQPAIAGDAVPLFTLRYGPGLAFAHTPADGQSFGQLRCRQVAGAFVPHLKEGRSGKPRVFFDSSAPWRGADPRLLVRLENSAGLVSSGRVHRRRMAPRDPEEGLHVLAGELTQTALIAGGRATWLVRDAQTGRLIPSGPSVYAGSAGCLAVLARAFRSDSQAGLSLLRAAARNVLHRQHELPLNGFHSGQAGTAAVLSETAFITGDDELADIAQVSRKRAATPGREGRAWDVVGGTAGTLLGLAAGASFGGLPNSDGGLARMANQLSDQAEPDGPSDGLRWRSQLGRRRPALAGLAHGASGAALALAAVDAEVYAETIERAVRFEDRSRSCPSGWVDQRKPGIAVPAVAWCHGAAGIGIASAAFALRDPQYKVRARLAADRILVALQRPIGHDRGLCHGHSGRALALAVIASVLNDRGLADTARFTLDTLDESLESEDLSLMTGRHSLTLARLAAARLCPAPIPFVLDMALWQECSPHTASSR